MDELNWKQRYAATELVELVEQRRMSRRDALRHLTVIMGSVAGASAFIAACSDDTNTNNALSSRPSSSSAPSTSTTFERAKPSRTAATNGTKGHVLSVAADDPALRGESVTFDGPASKMFGYVARPSQPGEYPGVVVIHEIFGLNDHTRDVARRLAKVGYIAIAPDLASRAGGTDKAPNVIEALVNGPASDNIADLNAAVDHVTQLPECDGNIGAVGFCFGGGMTLAMAGAMTSLSAAVSYYGVTPDPPTALRSTSAAVLAHYGASDDRVNAGIGALETALAGKTFTKHVWPGVGHQFNNDTSGAYNEAVAVAAWNETLEWFAKYLVP
jgi:carboxymethylenebutenolidase